MKVDLEDINAVSWLIELIHETAEDYTSDNNDMQERLMKISAYAYAIKKIDPFK